MALEAAILHAPGAFDHPDEWQPAVDQVIGHLTEHPGVMVIPHAWIAPSGELAHQTDIQQQLGRAGLVLFGASATTNPDANGKIECSSTLAVVATRANIRLPLASQKLDPRPEHRRRVEDGMGGFMVRIAMRDRETYQPVMVVAVQAGDAFGDKARRREMETALRAAGRTEPALVIGDFQSASLPKPLSALLGWTGRKLGALPKPNPKLDKLPGIDVIRPAFPGEQFMPRLKRLFTATEAQFANRALLALDPVRQAVWEACKQGDGFIQQLTAKHGFRHASLWANKGLARWNERFAGPQMEHIFGRFVHWTEFHQQQVPIGAAYPVTSVRAHMLNPKPLLHQANAMQRSPALRDATVPNGQPLRENKHRRHGRDNQRLEGGISRLSIERRLQELYRRVYRVRKWFGKEFRQYIREP